jgi:hypothetical protein
MNIRLSPILDTDTVRELARAGNRIELIKQYRALAGCGLKEAKEATDAIYNGSVYGNPGASSGFDPDMTVKLFCGVAKKITVIPKERMLKLIDRAFDCQSKMWYEEGDWLSILKDLVNNIEHRGGMTAIVNHYDEFLSSL